MIHEDTRFATDGSSGFARLLGMVGLDCYKVTPLRYQPRFCLSRSSQLHCTMAEMLSFEVCGVRVHR